MQTNSSSRIKELNNSNNLPGKCVLYVMSRDQRVQDNHALFYAQQSAIKNNLPIVVFFNLLNSTGERTREHYEFMISGLKQVMKELAELKITFILKTGGYLDNLVNVEKEINPSEIYFDFSPLDGPRKVVATFSKKSKSKCFMVDAHNIIPTWVASDKEEFSAYTMRIKIHKLLRNYLEEPPLIVPGLIKASVEGTDPDLFMKLTKDVVSKLTSSGINVTAKAGTEAGLKHLNKFIKNDLSDYSKARNDIANDRQSGLSPYLHFGQLSSLRIAHEVMKAANKQPLLFKEAKLTQDDGKSSIETGMNALFEEMIVRKELSDNFCLHSRSYNNLDGIRDWAKDTLTSHIGDKRDYVYSEEQWEGSQTHDPAWNAAQNQLRSTGKIHGYMRMYWAKKILEWSKSPEEAVRTAIYLNDKYSIDGGDPNGYVGILWSIGGIHDRPWIERKVFGKIRYMNSEGLKRKFDLDKYVKENSQTTLV